MNSIELVAEIILLAVLTAPLLRLLASRSFRRSFPDIAGIIVGGLIAYALFVGTLAIIFPMALRVIVVIAVIGLGIAYWRARPDWGIARGLPPGSLTVIPVNAMLDDLFYLKESRKFGAIFKVGGGLRRAAMSFLHQPMACIVGIEPARRLFAEHDAALRSPTVSYNRHIPRGFLRYMNDADHKTYRPIFQSAFAEASPLSTDSVAAEQIRRGLDQLVAECERTPSHGIQPFAAIHRLTLTLLLRFLFDINPGNEHYNRLVDLYRVIDLPIEERAQYGKFQLIVDEITNILRDQVGCIKTLRQSNASATPCVLEAILREHPSAIDDATVLGNLMFLARNSSSDLAGLWHWMLKMLGDHPLWLERLAATAFENTPGSLADRIVLETLRLEQSELLLRHVVSGISFDGVTIPRGWTVRVCIRESHRDPVVFPDPATFNPDRFLDRAYSRTEYAPFGFGKHSCIGSSIALNLSRLFAQELACGYNFQIVGDGAREFHRFHWSPSSDLRIRVSRRTG